LGFWKYARTQEHCEYGEHFRRRIRLSNIEVGIYVAFLSEWVLIYTVLGWELCDATGVWA
jgi:hypothetical protein